MSDAEQLLLRGLKKHFRKYTHPGDWEHEPLFLIVTALDPRYRLILKAVQEDCAKQELFKKLKEAAKEKNGASSTSESESHDITSEDLEEIEFGKWHTRIL